jgi:eukaryotic-like serine/threonine-protein kinase
MKKVGADHISARSSGQIEIDPASMSVRPGDVIAGKYEVLRLLGSGGMAFVVAARHIELDETVALKFLRSECLVQGDLPAFFVREARGAVKIKSEHVARVFDVGTLPDGAPFIVMEYLDGIDLRVLLHEEGPPPVERTAEYVMQVCEALAAAHAIGIVHRDIKPENLFLVNREQGLDLVKVLDFGISKMTLTGSSIDQSGLQASAPPVGTPLYMSPEQLRGSRDLDARADIWSLGCVLFELLTGKPPFDAPSIMMLIATILEHPTPRLVELCPDLPAGLDAVVGRCLEKEPRHRFDDVGDLAAALSPFAPARARISVERCNQLVQNGRPSDWAPEAPTDPPPSARLSNAAMTLPPADGTTNRAAEPGTDVDAESPTIEAKRRSKIARAAVACLVLAAGAFVLRRSSVAHWLVSAATYATSPQATPDPAAAAPSLEPEPTSIAVGETSAATAEHEVDDTIPLDAAIRGKANGRTHPSRPRILHPPPESNSQPSEHEDTDVGY